MNDLSYKQKYIKLKQKYKILKDKITGTKLSYYFIGQIDKLDKDRRAKLDKEYEQLLTNCFGSSSSLSSTATLFLGYKDAKLICTAAIAEHDVEPVFYIYNLCVQDNYRRIGLGRYMVEKIINYCESKTTAGTVTLDVDIDNTDAVKFYEALHFEKDSIKNDKLGMVYKWG